MKTIFILMSVSLFLMPSRIFSIEIPLEEEREHIAYINMHKIFETYPETEKARAELIKVINTKKEEITQRKEEIARLKGEIDAVTYTIHASSVPLKVGLENLLKEKETQLSKAQASLPAFLTMSEEEIRNAEEGKTMALLANIYKAVEALSKENKYTLVLDKENILYGTEALDLTPKILQLLENMK